MADAIGKKFKTTFKEVFKNAPHPDKGMTIQDEGNVMLYLYQHVKELALSDAEVERYVEYLLLTCFLQSGKKYVFSQELFKHVCRESVSERLEVWVSLIGNIVKEYSSVGKQRHILSFVEYLDAVLNKKHVSRQTVYAEIQQTCRELIQFNMVEETKWPAYKIQLYIPFKGVPLSNLYVLSLQLVARADDLRESVVPLAVYKEIFEC